MKTTTILSFLAAIVLSSCTTVYHTQSYEDANYLSPNEFAEFDDYTVQNTELEQEDEIYSDTLEDGTIVNNYYGDYYEADDYYDFSYSARIRRFHRPLWSMGYYGGLYTDYYWYSYNPYHCGMSIYNYYDPFYSPYYSWGYSGYYSPYYSYYNHHAYGHNNHYGYNNNYNNDTYSYNNSYDNNSIHYGPRGSLSSRTNTNRSVKSVVNTTNNKNSTYNKFDRMVDKKITTRTIKTNSNRSVKTNTNRTVTKSNTTKSSTNRGVKTNTYKSNSNRSSTKSNSYKKGNSKSNRSYTAPKSNSNRSYNNSRGSSTRSSGNSRSSGSSGSNNRSVKPRK